MCVACPTCPYSWEEKVQCNSWRKRKASLELGAQHFFFFFFFFHFPERGYTCSMGESV
jgi:hypothetical protein